MAVLSGMDLLLYAVSFVAAMVVHELGHFAAARWYGVRVTRVCLFFDANGRSLAEMTVGWTTWALGWLPLGSYTAVAGMERVGTGFAGEMVRPRAWEFQAQPRFERVVIVVAGVLANLVTCWAALASEIEWLTPLAWVSAANACYNLLPFRGSDGWVLVEVLGGSTIYKPIGRLLMLLGTLVLAAVLLRWLSP